MTIRKFMPNWQDGDRTWVDLGGPFEASYDGARYVDVRLEDTHERILFASKSVFQKALELFDPPPICD